MLIYSLPIFDTLPTEGGVGRAQRGASSKWKQPFCDLKTTTPVSPLVLRRLEHKGRMRWDVARADSPVECAIGVEV